MKIVNLFSNESKKEKQTAQITAQAAVDIEAQQEKPRKEPLTLTKTSRLGFPHKPTCMAYDSIQHLLAVGTKYGYVKLFGADSIEYTIFHGQAIENTASPIPSQTSGSLAAPYMTNNSSLTSNFGSAVLFMAFVLNEGALITYCEDSTLSFWNLRQKQPGVLFTRKLVNEK